MDMIDRWYLYTIINKRIENKIKIEEVCVNFSFFQMYKKPENLKIKIFFGPYLSVTKLKEQRLKQVIVATNNKRKLVF